MSEIRLGVIVSLTKDIRDEFKKICNLGFNTCQLVCWDEAIMSEDLATLAKKAVGEYHIDITAFWCGWPGPQAWNFYDGPITLGFTPQAYRWERMKVLVKGSDFAKKIGITDIATHAGFIPENPMDPDYTGLINAVRFIAQYCKNNGQYFLFETGQETPITLKRAIEDIGLDNLGINLDLANLLLYGKGNPIDALDVFGKYVRGVHAKDGEYPTTGKYLGEEKPLGQGRVNFPLLVGKLKALGYKGVDHRKRNRRGTTDHRHYRC